MGTGKKATGKKSTKTKKSTKKSNPEKDLLKERLGDTGPFVLRDFCSQHGMDPADSKKAPKNKLISFLIGKFDEGEITINDLYPEEDPEEVDVDTDDDEEEEETKSKSKKSKKPAKKRNAKKSKPKDDDDDEDDEDVDDDDDIDDDDDLDDDDDVECADDDDDDIDDDDEDDEPPKKGKSKAKGNKDSSALEDKVDKLIDLSTKLGHAVEELGKIQVEQKAFLKLVSAYLMKQGGLDKSKVSKLIKKWEGKAKEAAGTDDKEDE